MSRRDYSDGWERVFGHKAGPTFPTSQTTVPYDIAHPFIGQRVRVVSLEPSYDLPRDVLNKEGVIILIKEHSTQVFYFQVRLFDHRTYNFYPSHLISSTSIEEENFLRNDNARRVMRNIDEVRRRVHANKYL